MPEEFNNAPQKNEGAERLKQRDAALDALKKSAEEDAERIRAERLRLDEELEKRKRAYEDIKASEQRFLEERARQAEERPERRRKRRREPRRHGLGVLGTIRLVVSAVILLALIYLAVLYFPVIRGLFQGQQVSFTDVTLPESIEAFLPDKELGYNEIDFQNAILGEAREKSSLVVLEQDVIVDSEISQAIANIALFKKTKTVHSYGTGVYAVNLSGLTKDNVAVDLREKTITVTIPHAVLEYITIDPSLTTFEDTERAILAFGDITLTPEQQKLLETTIKESMEERLNREELFNEADRLAAGKVTDLFFPLVNSVAEGFRLYVIQNG